MLSWLALLLFQGIEGAVYAISAAIEDVGVDLGGAHIGVSRA